MYIVIELQTSKDDELAYLVSTHPTREEADSKFHLILSAAAVSSIPIHAAAILDEFGCILANGSYVHEV